MKLKKRIAVLGASLMLAVSMMSVGVSASSTPYHTPTKTFVTNYLNSTNWNYTIHANTRPTQGTGGVTIIAEKPNGDFVNSKNFPYYQNVSDLLSTIGSKKEYYYFAQPCVTNQWVAGNLSLL